MNTENTSSTNYTDDIPDFADVMTKDDFIIHVVENGFFIPDDGSGYPVKDGKMDRTRDVFPVADIPADATHVAWFNKWENVMTDQTRHLLERTLEGITQLETTGCSTSWDELKRDINRVLRPPKHSEREEQFLTLRAAFPDFAPEMQQSGVMWGLVEDQAAFFPISSNYVGFYLDDCARKLTQSFLWLEANYRINESIRVEYYTSAVRMKRGQSVCRGRTPLEALATDKGVRALLNAAVQKVEP